MSQKEKFALYLTPEMKARLERRYTDDGSRSLTGCCFANKLRKFFKQSAKKKRRLKGF